MIIVLGGGTSQTKINNINEILYSYIFLYGKLFVYNDGNSLVVFFYHVFVVCNYLHISIVPMCNNNKYQAGKITYMYKKIKMNNIIDSYETVKTRIGIVLYVVLFFSITMR